MSETSEPTHPVSQTVSEQQEPSQPEEKQVEVPQVQETIEGQQQQQGQQEQQQVPKKSKYLKCNFKSCKNYEDQNLIAKSFPQLASLQTPLEIEGIQNALCYVIRSNNEDDVHKAIKYGIWTSVPGNNVKLNQAYEQSVALNVDVYLFFSVVKSRQFIGVAKLKSSFQEETFSYWWQPHKFKGHFKIEWVFVKDVKQKAFEGLKNSQNDDISRSKDCTELNFEATGKKMLQIYKDAPVTPSIFQGFQYLDQKEQFLRNAYFNLGRQGNKNQNYNNNMNQQRANAPQQQQLGNMMYQNYFLNPQMFSQMGQTGMFPQYTPEQLNQFSQMCYTNIYPPNTYPSNNYYNGQHGHNHHNKNYNNGNNNNTNNNNNNNNSNAHRRNQKKNNNNNTKNQNDAPLQQPKLSEQDPCLPTAAEQTA